MINDYHKSDYSKFKPVGFPVSHRKKEPFEPRISLSLDYRKILNEIRELDRELNRFVLSYSDYKDLVDEAYANNIHWSVKIEGNKLSLEEVRRLTSRFTERKADERDPGPRQEIINHLYSFFMRDEFDLPWSKETVLKLHKLLMTDVSDNLIPGKIRDREVSVYGPDGTEYFRTCPSIHIEEELQNLLNWLNYSPYDEIITATIFFHEFESIHPFSDGNGRTGRTLFQILMQEFGLKNCKLCKFEAEMLSDSATYYDLLAYTDATGVYTQLVMYVAESLLIAYRKAVEEFGSRDQLRDLDENYKALVEKARTVDRFTIRDAHAWAPALSEQTLRTKLDTLVNRGILEKQGATRGMTYRFGDPFREIKDNLRGTIDIDDSNVE